MNWLFWLWAAVTVAAFIDILAPDPLKFIDAPILVLASLALLVTQAVLGTLSAITSLWNNWGVGIITFATTLLGLFLIDRVSKPRRKRA